jgi:hypothetical protein
MTPDKYEIEQMQRAKKPQLRAEPKKRSPRIRVAGVLCIRGEHFLLIGAPKAEPNPMKQTVKARRDRKRTAFLAAVAKFDSEVQVKAALGIDVAAEWKDLCKKFGERS